MNGVVAGLERPDDAAAVAEVAQREVDALHRLMDSPGLVNVVVDVGNAPHYGSLVIGAIMALCKKANNRGGLAAFCNASEGMLDMLQIMEIDSVMPYYPTRREAIYAVRRRPSD